MRVICSTPSDRRSHLRGQRHAAIVEAARALATEHGADGFTVEGVATVAGVSRRTVFNHFSGIDQLLVAVCEQIFTEVTVELLESLDRGTASLPQGAAGSRAALDALCESTRSVDLPAAIATVHRVLGRPDPADERADTIARTALEHVVGRLRERLVARAPGVDALDLELTLTLLTSGLAAIGQRWVEDHHDLPTDVPTSARTDWDHLLDRLLHRLRTGYAG
ncbi:transcriptional regulator, TetR family [Nocardioides alpinus]|uniref:Transcriptional regulator, TetR family n=1 Tax=Nocardioides alpinus TaxID=748909 RepID=A0A1I0Z808_9ACTN|nr:transcriptional regulator, TetR family [Nocardioides alpinus]